MASSNNQCNFYENFTRGTILKKNSLTPNLTFLFYTVFTVLVAFAFVYIQRKKSKKKITLTTMFNAGGSMPISLLASTIISQWTWAASLLQSTTVGTLYGLSGSYWYASGACVQILLFSIICIEMKIKAPGASTFLQLIKARFDTKTHILYCVYALLTNAIVTSMLLVGGVASISYSYDKISGEYAILLFLISMSVYVFLGGLGSLFILLVIIIMFMRIFYSGQTNDSDVGNLTVIYERFKSYIKKPDSYKKSYKTFISSDALVFGIINLIGNFGAVFVDQSYWQVISCSTPKKSSIAFIVAGFIWFFIPFCFGTTMSVGYLYLNSFYSNCEQGYNLLEHHEIDSGLVVPLVADLTMGSVGIFFCNLMIIFAVTTTGGSEILAATSIIINDIYSVYFYPYGTVKNEERDYLICILCNRLKGKVGRDKCTCTSVTYCQPCVIDDQKLKRREISMRTCEMHGAYRNYEDELNVKKQFSIIYVAFFILISTLVLYQVNLSLNWMYLFMGILVGPAVIPITMSVFCARVNSLAMFFSLIIGTLAGIISWILTSCLYYGGFNIEKSGSLLSMLVGNVASISIGGICCLLITFFSTKALNIDQISQIWEKTRDIDSPLLPWTELYAQEISIENAFELKQRPPLNVVTAKLSFIKKLSWILSITFSLSFIFIIPIACLNFGDFSNIAFRFWIIIGQTFIFISFLYLAVGNLPDKFIKFLLIKKSKNKIKQSETTTT